MSERYERVHNLGSTIRGIESVELRLTGSSLNFFYIFQTEAGYRCGKIVFQAVSAHRFDSIDSVDDLVEEAYDGIVRAHGTPWLEAGREHHPCGAGLPEREELKHYILVGSNWGVLQVLAEDFAFQEIAWDLAPESLKAWESAA